jgi:hypothetical protein
MTEHDRNRAAAARSIHEGLKAQSRRRRGSLKSMAQVSTSPHPARNDLVPKLELVERAPGSLVIPARNVRKIEPAHVREVATAITTLGFCDPVLIDERNGVLDGAVRVEAAKSIGLPLIPCIIANHLSASERKLLRIALNRLQEKGGWDLDELKLELDELILEEAPIEVTGFSLTEIDQIVLDEGPAPVEVGPLAPKVGARPIARLGDTFILGEHRITCGDATDPAVLKAVMSDSQARLILTDEPYNCAIAGHVTRGAHREFPMASGEMNDAEFRVFNGAWMEAALAHLCDGGVLGTFIDWRGFPTVNAAAIALGLVPINCPPSALVGQVGAIQEGRISGSS